MGLSWKIQSISKPWQTSGVHSIQGLGAAPSLLDPVMILGSGKQGASGFSEMLLLNNCIKQQDGWNLIQYLSQRPLKHCGWEFLLHLQQTPHRKCNKGGSKPLYVLACVTLGCSNRWCKLEPSAAVLIYSSLPRAAYGLPYIQPRLSATRSISSQTGSTHSISA